MNIVSRLTLRHMRLNKKRTVVTIIGVIISVAMIMAVSVIAYSFSSFMSKRAMETSGNFHVIFEKTPYENANTILKSSEIESSFLGKVIDDIYLEDIYKENNIEATDDLFSVKSVYRMVGFEEEGFESYYFGDYEGEMPKNENELFISVMFCETLGIEEIGDKLILKGKEYTISGIYSGFDFESVNIDIENQMTYILYTYFNVSTLSKGDNVNVYSLFNAPSMSIYDSVTKLEQDAGSESSIVNSKPLYYYGIGRGSFGSTMSTIKYILIGIIMIGAVSLISNGFSISLSERSRYLGMLASVGATKAQKRFSVFFEGFIIGIISIPLGIIGGIAGTAVTFKIIESRIQNLVWAETTTSLEVDVKLWVVMVTVLFSVITIFLSAYIPARRASKITPIDAIRQAKDIKVSKKQVKTLKLTKKIFGFEGDLALKNLKRNKKRYRITIFSMVISIILFLTVYSFVYYMKNSLDMVYQDYNYDMSMGIYNGDEETNQNIYNEIRKSEFIDKSCIKTEMTNLFISMTLRDTNRYLEDSYKKFYLDMNSYSITEEDIPALEMCLYTYDETYLKELLGSLGKSYEEFLSDKNNVIIINTGNTNIYKDGSPVYYMFNYLNISEGEKIDCLINKKDKDYTGFDKDRNDYSVDSSLSITNYADEIKFEIYAISDELPMGFTGRYDAQKINIIITNELMQEINKNAVQKNTVNESDFRFQNMYFYGGDNQQLLEELSRLEEKYNVVIDGYDINESIKNDEDTLFLISIFTYGFIILMTLVSTTNIFNTISTSFSLRRREFATLRSVGMTKKSFNKMIVYESAFYGMKSILYGLPISIGIMYWLHYVLREEFNNKFSLPIEGMLIVIVAVFLITSMSMMYSSSKIKKSNIIEALRNENV